MSLRAGQLRHEVTLQSRLVAQDASGSQSVIWTDVATKVRASIEPSVGRERLAAAAINIDQPSTITLRWRPELDNPKAVAAMRVVFRNRLFDIHSVDNQDARNRVVVLIASEGMNNG